jgi:hypothetical protein
MRTLGSLLLALILAGFLGTSVSADEVTDWNAIMFQAAHVAVTNPIVMSRNAAIVQAAVFDAVNGIDRRATPLHVPPAAPRGASRRAAAVQAAYATLVKLYPAQQATLLDPARAASLGAVAREGDREERVSIGRGIAWGQTVADAIWAWRLGDGVSTPTPPFLGGAAAGQWRPTLPALLPGALPQWATMTPWVIASPSAYRPAGPPALDSARYAVDFAETASMGRSDSLARTADETLFSLFWNSATAPYLWDQAAVALSRRRHLRLSENARLLALLNVAMADAAIGCWDAKYRYTFWRPITAIPLAATDGNPATAADAAWTPLFATPNHPEYPSGHSCLSGAAGRILSNYFGEGSAFSVTSDSPAMAGVVRSFTSFTSSTDEVKNARVFAGIHFRSACDDGQTLGALVADEVQAHAFLPLHRDESRRSER